MLNFKIFWIIITGCIVAFSQPLTPEQTVNTVTGELVFSLPITTVQSTTHALPISLDYSSDLRSAGSFPCGNGFTCANWGISRKTIFIPDDATKKTCYINSWVDEDKTVWRTIVFAAIEAVVAIIGIVASIFTAGASAAAAAAINIAITAVSVVINIGCSMANRPGLASFNTGSSLTPSFNYDLASYAGVLLDLVDDPSQQSDLTDLYFVNTPYFSGQFMWVGGAPGSKTPGHFVVQSTTGNSTKDKSTVKILPGFDSKKQLSKFTIITEDGIRLSFDVCKKIWYHQLTYSKLKQAYSDCGNKKAGDLVAAASDYYEEDLPAGWLLTQILFPDGDYFDLDYAAVVPTTQGIEYSSFPFVKQLKIGQMVTKDLFKVNELSQWDTHYYLREIKSKNQSALFTHRLGDLREPIWGSSLLSNIQIFENQKLLDVNNFLYEGLGVVGIENPKSGRIVFDFYNTKPGAPVSVDLPLMSDNYYEYAFAMRNVSSYAKPVADMWGFSYPISKFNDNNWYGIKSNQYYSTTIPWAARSALKSVTFPQGYKISWEFEPHAYRYVNGVDQGVTKYGGGIRVKRATAQDYMHNTEEVRYFYTQNGFAGTDDENSSGTVSALPMMDETLYPPGILSDPRPDYAKGGLYTNSQILYDVVTAVKNFKSPTLHSGYVRYHSITTTSYPNLGKYGQVDESWRRGLTDTVEVFDAKSRRIRMERNIFRFIPNSDYLRENLPRNNEEYANSGVIQLVERHVLENNIDKTERFDFAPDMDYATIDKVEVSDFIKSWMPITTDDGTPYLAGKFEGWIVEKTTKFGNPLVDDYVMFAHYWDHGYVVIDVFVLWDVEWQEGYSRASKVLRTVCFTNQVTGYRNCRITSNGDKLSISVDYKNDAGVYTTCQFKDIPRDISPVTFLQTPPVLSQTANTNGEPYQLKCPYSESDGSVVMPRSSTQTDKNKEIYLVRQKTEVFDRNGKPNRYRQYNTSNENSTHGVTNRSWFEVANDPSFFIDNNILTAPAEEMSFVMDPSVIISAKAALWKIAAGIPVLDATYSWVNTNGPLGQKVSFTPFNFHSRGLSTGLKNKNGANIWVQSMQNIAYDNNARVVESSSIKKVGSINKELHTSAYYGHRGTKQIATVLNAFHEECSFLPGDYDDDPENKTGLIDMTNNWLKCGARLVSVRQEGPGAGKELISHFGKQCLYVDLPVGSTFGPTKNHFITQGKDYYFTAWVKVVSGTLDMYGDYRKESSLGVRYEPDGRPTGSFPGIGVTDGWVQIVRKFETSTDLPLSLWSDAGTPVKWCIRLYLGSPNGVRAYMDDIRVYPTDALATTQFYDPVWLTPTVTVSPNGDPSNEPLFDNLGRVASINQVKKNGDRVKIQKIDYHDRRDANNFPATFTASLLAKKYERDGWLPTFKVTPLKEYKWADVSYDVFFADENNAPTPGSNAPNITRTETKVATFFGRDYPHGFVFTPATSLIYSVVPSNEDPKGTFNTHTYGLRVVASINGEELSTIYSEGVSAKLADEPNLPPVISNIMVYDEASLAFVPYSGKNGNEPMRLSSDHVTFSFDVADANIINSMTWTVSQVNHKTDPHSEDNVTSGTGSNIATVVVNSYPLNGSDPGASFEYGLFKIELKDYVGLNGTPVRMSLHFAGPNYPVRQ